MVLRLETASEWKGAATKVCGITLAVPSRLSLVALCTATALAAAAAFATIPPPPWGTSAPTNGSQVLSYVLAVMSNLPPEAVDEINAAQQRIAQTDNII